MTLATSTATAPVLTSATPADNSGAVSASANIVLNFSSAVHAGSGYITISDGATQTYMGRDGLLHTRLVGVTDTRTISIADASQVTINGSQVTINLSSDLKAGVSYSVQMGSGVLLGESNLSYAGLADATKLNFAVSAATVPAPTAVVDTLSMYSWGSEGPFVTNIAAQHFSGTINGALNSGEKVEVSIDGTTWHSATVSGSNWSYDATIAASGTLRARVSNSAGVSTEPLSQAYTYDTTGPVISSISLSKEALSVGESATLTVVFSEKVTGLTLDAFGKHNSLLRGLEASADGKTWTATVTMGSEGLLGGDVALSPSAVKDGAGNYGTGDWNTVTYTRKPGSLAETSVTLKADSDTGQHTDDGLTKDDTPTVHLDIGHVAGLLAGDIIKIYDEASERVVGTHTVTAYDLGMYGGSIDIDIDAEHALAEGTHQLVAYAIDAAGVGGATTGTALDVTVDTTGPAITNTSPANGPAVDPGLQTITLTFSEDIDWSASDGITIVDDQDNPVLDLTFETPPPAGEEVPSYSYLSYDSETHVLTIKLHTPLAAGKGYGVYSVGEIKDLAHNTYAGNTQLLGFLINGEGQAIPLAPTLAITDTGAAGDGVTSNGTITVSGMTASHWKYSLDGGASYSDERNADGGNVTFDIPNDGSYEAGKILVKQYNTAGQESSAGSLAINLTVDRVAPEVSVLSAGSFSQGASVISGSYQGTLLSGEVIQYSLNGTDWSAATAANGTWSVSGVTLGESGKIALRVADLAGNLAENPHVSDTLPTWFGSSSGGSYTATASTVLVAGAGNDGVGLVGGVAGYLDGGAGDDTLMLVNSLNLASAAGQIKNFENISLGSNVTLTLGSMAAVAELNLPGSLISGFSLLTVEGASSAHIDLAGTSGWRSVNSDNIFGLGLNLLSELLGWHNIYVNTDSHVIMMVGSPQVDNIAGLL
jgi:methionine-rich copper-binding protein CopC